MGPLEAFELRMLAQIAEVQAQAARVETQLRMGLWDAYREQKRIDDMHAERLKAQS